MPATKSKRNPKIEHYGTVAVAGPIRRFVICAIFLLVLLTKPLRSLQRRFPYRMRELGRNWDYKMLWTFISSLGMRVYIDQNCVLKDPPSFEPRIQTRPEWQLTAGQIRSFYENGFLGPITLWTPEEMKEIRTKVETVLHTASQVYPGEDTRDRHIEAPEFWEIISAPQIVERLAQFLGPDLLVWRSQIFNKEPGAAELTWHQASTYMFEDRLTAVLEPPDRDQLFEVGAWIAIDDAYLENGCLHFLKGTHRKMWTMLRGSKGYIGNPPEAAKIVAGKGRFVNGGLTAEIPITDEMIVPMPLKSGQCVLFTERCMHGSPPNISRDRRFGFAFRAIPPDVAAYPGQAFHKVAYFNTKYDLSKWGCMLLRGQDRYHRNRMIFPPTHRKEVLVKRAATR
jgi:non-haem Fe2+, alpha-ketoglutarate-dependent halogenase